MSTTPNIVPRGDQEGGLGTAAKSWGKLFIENAIDNEEFNNKGNSLAFEVEDKWVDLLQLVLMTTIGAYFGGRSVEKYNKIKNNSWRYFN